MRLFLKILLAIISVLIMGTGTILISDLNINTIIAGLIVFIAGFRLAGLLVNIDSYFIKKLKGNQN